MKEMWADVRAADRYYIRFGDLRRGELVLEALASVGFDMMDIAALGAPIAPMICAVIEIVDQHDGQVARRIREDIDTISDIYDRARRDLHHCDVRTFVALWNLPQGSGT